MPFRMSAQDKFPIEVLLHHQGPMASEECQKINRTQYNYKFLHYRGSVLPKILVPLLLMTMWGVLWTLLFMLLDLKNIGLPSILIGILNVVVGMLLVFRTNTANDRFWEARKLWGQIYALTRSLARNIWVDVKQVEGDAPERIGALKLLLAFSVACKHYLRKEFGTYYDDLQELINHVPSLQECNVDVETKNLPLIITFHLSAYIDKCLKDGLISVSVAGNMLASLNSLTLSFSECERIRDCPVPFAYAVHLNQTVILYLITLPFQLLQTCGWSTIPIVAISSFILLGVEVIGEEIENPFGYDKNDLRMDKFVDVLKTEIFTIIQMGNNYGPQAWEPMLK